MNRLLLNAGRCFSTRCLASMLMAAMPLAACTSPPAATPLGQSPVVRSGTSLTDSYQLSPGDDIQIRFQYDTDLDDEAVIGPDNKISLRYVNSIQVGGKSVPEATALLNRQYDGYIKEPNITVSVKQFALQEIYVEGQVNSPGLVRDTVPLTLSHAIAEAGGLKTSTAVLKNVLLVRRAPDGSLVYYKINMVNGVAGPTIDPLLDSYDLVYIPEKPISQVAEFVGNNLGKLVPYSFAVQETP